MAAGADAFLVAADGGLGLVARDAAGVSLKVDRTQDGGHYGTLTLDNAPAQPIAGDLAEAIEEATLATAAYLLGVTERAFAMTLAISRPASSSASRSAASRRWRIAPPISRSRWRSRAPASRRRR